MIEFTVKLAEQRKSPEELEKLLAEPGFGQVFTEHMITIEWDTERGWHDAQLRPYGPLSLDPATKVFHYAQELFEGMKAYRQPDGSIVSFRPEANAARFNVSCRRMAMPELPEETFLEALRLLVDADRDWVPTREGHSLYLRPFIIATETGMGVNYPSSKYLFCVIASPSAAYFSGAIKPVSVWLSTEYTRAAPGGTGFAKCGGNYAAAFVAQQEAVAQGCDQVVWLDSAEHRWVEEMGGMNLFFVYGSGADARIITPPTTGTILPGITRDSLLRLAPDLGIKVSEEPISVEQWQADVASGALTEVFACGTAAVITPVGRVKGAEGEFTISEEGGPVTLRLREELVGIQYGNRPDPYQWITNLA
ncbi:branched-chain amino acid aminotransferase [Actinocorallia aurea]